MPNQVKIEFAKPQEFVEAIRALSLPSVTEMEVVPVPDGILLRPIVSPLPTDPTELRGKFTALAEQWNAEKGPHSLVCDLVNHPAYREIIGFGPAVIPLILERLEVHLEDWFPALTAITGIDPVPLQSAGNLDEMAHAWKKWGREHGYWPPVV